MDKSKMTKQYDFAGWATRNDIPCSDGRVIKSNAFKDNDGEVVPLVWNHNHDDPSLVLGHALLQNRPEGVYCYGSFNDTSSGQVAKVLVQHGDIDAISIYANQLRQNNHDVVHGRIREVSLVHAGANPGAYIETILAHSADGEEEAIIFTGETLVHSANKEETNMKKDQPVNPEYEEDEDEEDGETLQDVFDTLSEKQKNAVYAIMGLALEDQENQNKEKESGDDMKHNVFDNDEMYDDSQYISHSDMMAVISDAKRFGSMRESALEHGIDRIDYLFPEAQTLNTPPDWIQRDTGWVRTVMNSVHHTPMSRIKSLFADITEDDARAKGYIKGNMKKEEVFSLLKRTTTPTTVYKKQKIDRDDMIDITDFDVVAWLKSEMRLMLDEELARAYLIGDGRLNSSDDKINESNIRPIMKDEDLFTIKKKVVADAAAITADPLAVAKRFIVAAIKARKDYKGSGNPTLYCTEDLLTDMLLITDSTGRDIYESVDRLCNKLRVSSIVTVPVFEGVTGPQSGELLGIIVNLADYNVGADKGGAINLFDDFDIDYNAQKYLIETRCSGALIKPYSAIVLERTNS